MSDDKRKLSTQPLKGMDDFYPEDLRVVNYIKSVVDDIVELYCFEEFESPLLEPIEIFAAKSSEELVNEQSFIVEKKKGKRLILRPELTPSLARMIAKKSQELKKPIRWYSFPTCYRYEETQRGRRRSFLQINADILFSKEQEIDELFYDLEIFCIIVKIFEELGATSDQFQIYYNNRRFIDEICRQVLKIPKEKLPIVYKLLDKSDKMEGEEFKGYVLETFQNEKIMQGIFNLKDAETIEELLEKFEAIPEAFFKSEGYIELVNFEKLLTEEGISEYCSFSSKVVRGLDYYTGIVYEVFDTGTENRRSIFGGGRYDDLISLFSDEQISGTGFGMGVYMLSLFLETYDLIPDEICDYDYSDVIYIASISKELSLYALEIARIIRSEDLPCIIDYRFKGLKNQLSRANDLGVSITLIIGPKEMSNNQITIKNMITEKQETIDKSQLIDKIYDLFDELE